MGMVQIGKTVTSGYEIDTVCEPGISIDEPFRLPDAVSPEQGEAFPVSVAPAAGFDRQPPDTERGQYRSLSEVLAIAPTVSVVIPVKNEARNLPVVLGTVPEWVDEVVLVDGRSVDDTIAVARQYRSDINVVTQPGTGKGDALLAGFRACTRGHHRHDGRRWLDGGQRDRPVRRARWSPVPTTPRGRVSPVAAAVMTSPAPAGSGIGS